MSVNSRFSQKFFIFFPHFAEKIGFICKKNWKILDYPLFLHYKFATIKN